MLLTSCRMFYYFKIYYFGEYFQIVIFLIKHLLLKPLVIFTINYPIYLCLDSITQVSTLSLPTWVINEAAGWERRLSYLTFPPTSHNFAIFKPLEAEISRKRKKIHTLVMYISCQSICMSLRNLLFNGHIYGYIAVGEDINDQNWIIWW